MDELQLTLTPKVIGGEYTWLPIQIENLPTKLSIPEAWILKENERLGDNELLLRYFRNRNQHSGNASA